MDTSEKYDKLKELVRDLESASYKQSLRELSMMFLGGYIDIAKEYGIKKDPEGILAKAHRIISEGKK